MTPSRLLSDALEAGICDLKRHALLLDEINVFPVMDADTGANMSAALTAVSALSKTLGGAPLSAFPKILEGPLLSGARGNSGIILAQFILGFLDVIAREETISLPSFAAAASNGRDNAYRAVAAPREGTMLTAMTAFRDTLAAATAPFNLERHDVLEKSLAEVVRQTRDQMSALRDAGVPDAGALGFYLLACGMTLALPALDDPPPGEAAIADRASGRTTALGPDLEAGIERRRLTSARRQATCDTRYCINLLIETAGGDTHRKPTVDGLGVSVNVAVSGRWMKVHVHADDPDPVIAHASRLGTIRQTAVQDMAAALIQPEKEGLPRDHLPIRIAADSAISLDRAEEAKLGIARIDNSINIDGRMIRDADVNLQELMTLMSQGQMFTTAQISPTDARRFVDATLETSDRMLFIAVGHAYTGTQSTVRQVCDDHPERARIRVLDSRAASGQQGLVCVAVARYAARIGDFDRVVAYAKQQITGSREYLVIDDLTYLQRSGRIGRIKAAFASLLSIKPIVGHGGDGAVTYAKVKNNEAAVDEIARRVVGHPGEGKLLIMVEYTDNRELAERIRQRLLEATPEPTEVLLSPLSSSSAVHMGPGTWGVAVTRVPE